MLLANTATTQWAGKWHLTPTEQCSAAGPYDWWPLGRGFERFYGFMGGDTSQYYPDLVYDNHQVYAAAYARGGLPPDRGSRSTTRLSFIADARQVAPEQALLHVLLHGRHARAPPRASSSGPTNTKDSSTTAGTPTGEKVYERQLALGILPAGTKPSPRDPDTTAWDSLGADEKRLYARMMEVFAGFLEHTDHQVGRLIAVPRADPGALEDTLITAISDNGASAEGGPPRLDQREPLLQQRPRDAGGQPQGDRPAGRPAVLQPLPMGLGLGGKHAVSPLEARDLPRRRLPDPFIVHWPSRIKARGEIRNHYAHPHRHAADGAGRSRPRGPQGSAGRDPVPDRRRVVSRTRSETPRPKTRHHTQYFEMMGHRAIYHDGWRAVCPVPGPSFAEVGMGFGEMAITEEKLTRARCKGLGALSGRQRLLWRRRTSPPSTATS